MYFTSGVTTADTLVEYFKKHSPVHPSVEWRINYANKNDHNNQGHSGSNKIYNSIGLTIFLPIISWLLLR